MHRFFFLAALLTIACIPNSQSLQFTFLEFADSDSSNFTFGNSSASIHLGSLGLPGNSSGKIENKVGRALYNTKFNLWKKKGKNTPFSTKFFFYIRAVTDPSWGEGFAFILTGHKNVSPDSYGQWLGVVDPSLNGSAQAQTVAIEFDTRKSYPEDLDDNHVGLDINSIYSAKQFSLSPYDIILSFGYYIHVDIKYDGKNLTVSTSTEQSKSPSMQVFSEEIDLSKYLPSEVYVGFSASTSNITQLNYVTYWKFQSFDEGSRISWPAPVVASVAVVLFAAAVVACIAWGRRRYYKDEDNIEDEINVCSTAPTRFRYKELRKATDSFSESNLIGEGGFGKVYRGVLDGETVAVKKIRKDRGQGKREFIAEVTTIGNINHRNLVKLLGWCCDKAEYLLVYEYMVNGSLERFSNPENETLSWKTRINVLSGVAQAVAYLHGGCGKTVFHRDIKPSNIMLDSDFNAKLGDFGLARTIKNNGDTHHSTIEIAGTPGYVAPEYLFTRWSTPQTDVYSFGVVALELGCGGRQGAIVDWIWDLYDKGAIVEAADKRLSGELSEEEIRCLLVLGLACCHPNPYERPSMNAVVQVLKGEAPVPEVQRERPRFEWPVKLPPGYDYSLVGCQIDPITILDPR